jgi:hypothetical protein
LCAVHRRDRPVTIFSKGWRTWQLSVLQRAGRPVRGLRHEQWLAKADGDGLVQEARISALDGSMIDVAGNCCLDHLIDGFR